MTPEQQRQRIEAAVVEGLDPLFGGVTWSWTPSVSNRWAIAEKVLDAADSAVPVVAKELLQRAIENAIQLDQLRRLHEDRTELKQKLRAAEAAKAEADWQKTTIEAELGGERQIRKRLSEELAQAHVVREFGEEYDQGYGRPIRNLGNRAVRAEAAARDFARVIHRTFNEPNPLRGMSDEARQVLDKHPGWVEEQ